jgi:hypothetical protein
MMRLKIVVDGAEQLPFTHMMKMDQPCDVALQNLKDKVVGKDGYLPHYEVRSSDSSQTLNTNTLPQQVQNILELDNITRVYDGDDCTAGDVFCDEKTRQLVIKGTSHATC